VLYVWVVSDAQSCSLAPARANGEVLVRPVLLLNRYYVPICVSTVRRALTMMYTGTAQAIDETGQSYDFPHWRMLPVRRRDKGLPIVGGCLRVPCVVHLQRYERIPSLAIRLTRSNLLLRDNQQCQYCGSRPGIRHLNVDHVRPRSRGGTDSWENLVVSCRSCNLKKGQRTPEEAGMRLIRPPRRPRWSATAMILMSLEEPLREWQPFLKAG
jgi:hypothetical protein